MKSVVLFCTIFVLSLLISLSKGGSPSVSGDRVLVLLDDIDAKSSHSVLFDFLSKRGYDITYKRADSSVELRKYGEWKYDHMVALVENSEISDMLDEVLAFIDSGRNAFLASSTSDDLIAEVAGECGAEFGDASTKVIDHVAYDQVQDDGSHTRIIASDIADSKLITNGVKGKILYEGAGQRLDSDNVLVFPLVSAATTAYTADPQRALQAVPHTVGTETVLISGLQARNNARVILSGSSKMFSNAFYSADVAVSGDKQNSVNVNQKLTEELLMWAFKERGVLRSTNVKHHKVGEDVAPYMYRIKDEVTFSMDIEIYSDGKWAPFDADDVQLEFVMLDPYVRTNFDHKNGHFSKTFMLPDVYGVFTFKVFYHRLGLTSLDIVERSPVRPFLHTEYERFIPSAFPYYASAFSMMAGVFLFSALFLYSKE